MTQHDYSIANQNFPATRTDINNALASILSLNAGTSAPTTTTAGMLWYDTTNGLMKQRNAADSAWITLFAIGKQGLIDQDGSTVYAADSVGTDSYAITLSPAITAYAAGQVFRFKVGTANTGAATLNVNSVGAIAIKKGYNLALATGDIVANQIVEVIYDGTNFQMLSPVSTLIRYFESSDQTITTSGTLSLSHGLGVVPLRIDAFLICQTGEGGYSAGDIVPVGFHDYTGSGGIGFSATLDSSSVNIQYGNASNVFYICKKSATAGSSFATTNGNWKLRIRAWA